MISTIPCVLLLLWCKWRHAGETGSIDNTTYYSCVVNMITLCLPCILPPHRLRWVPRLRDACFGPTYSIPLKHLTVLSRPDVGRALFCWPSDICTATYGMLIQRDKSMMFIQRYKHTASATPTSPGRRGTRFASNAMERHTRRETRGQHVTIIIVVNLHSANISRYPSTSTCTAGVTHFFQPFCCTTAEFDPMLLPNTFVRMLPNFLRR